MNFYQRITFCLLFVMLFCSLSSSAQFRDRTSKPLIHYYTSSTIEADPWIDELGDLLYKKFSPDSAIVLAFHDGGDFGTSGSAANIDNFDASIGEFYFNGKQISIDTDDLNNNIPIFQELLNEFKDTNIYQLTLWGEYIEQPDVMTTNCNFNVTEWETIEHEIYGGPFVLQHGIPNFFKDQPVYYNHVYRSSLSQPFGNLFDFLPIDFQWDPLQQWGNGEYIPDFSRANIFGGRDLVGDANPCYILFRKEGSKYIPFIVDCIPFAEPKYGTSSTEDNIKTQFDFDVYSDSETLYLNIEGFHDNVSVNVFDIQGRKMNAKFVDEHQSQTSLDISPLSPGMYIVQARDNEKVASKKFFKN